MDMDTLKAECLACTRCELCATRLGGNAPKADHDLGLDQPELFPQPRHTGFAGFYRAAGHHCRRVRAYLS